MRMQLRNGLKRSFSTSQREGLSLIKSHKKTRAEKDVVKQEFAELHANSIIAVSKEIQKQHTKMPSPLPKKVPSKMPPENWKETYEKIRNMRKDIVAPVDTMGCECLADMNVDPKVKRFQILVSLILSSQTKDTVTAIAMGKLKKRGLYINNVLNMTETEIDTLIKMVGFHSKKAQ